MLVILQSWLIGTAQLSLSSWVCLTFLILVLGGFPLPCKWLQCRGHCPSRFPFAVLFFIDSWILRAPKLISPDWQANLVILRGDVAVCGIIAHFTCVFWGAEYVAHFAKNPHSLLCFSRWWTFSQEVFLLTFYILKILKYEDNEGMFSCFPILIFLFPE